MINENLTNEEEADFNDKYTRILVKYPKENNVKTSNLNSIAELDHSSETKHGNYAIEYCITSLGEYISIAIALLLFGQLPCFVQK